MANGRSPSGARALAPMTRTARLSDRVADQMLSAILGCANPDELLATLSERGIPIGAALGPPSPEVYEDAPPNMKKVLAQLGLTPEQMIEMRRAMVGRMHAAGARFVGGSDAGIERHLAHGLMRSGLAFLVSAVFPALSVPIVPDDPAPEPTDETSGAGADRAR